MRSLLPVLAFLTACATEAPPPAAPPAPPAPEAAPPAPPPAPPAAALSAPALTAPSVLEVDAAQTKISATGAKITGSHPVDFPATAGKVGLDGDKLVGLSFAVDMAAIVSDKEKLTEHLKSADFFDVGAFAQATFVSTAVAAGAAPNAYSVTGDLTIRGKSKSIVVPVTLTADAAQVSGSAEFTINRQDFGVAYPGKPDDLIKDEVPVKASFVAKR